MKQNGLMQKPLLTLLTILILVLSGCLSSKHHYPLWSIPEKPQITFTDGADIDPVAEHRLHCLNDADLRRLNAYVISLNGAVQKYQRQIEIINGDRP